jgi:anti-sigma regulatory factor (Ser/Thr protein kinase)
VTATTAPDPFVHEDPFIHEGLFYADLDEYLDGCLSFVRDGLAAGAPVLVAVPHWNLRPLTDALGPDAGRVRLADMTRAGRNPGRIIPWVLNAFVSDHAGRHPRIIGEPIWAGRTDEEYPACAQHEALINAAFTGRAATILCPYDTGRLARPVLDDAERTHPILVDASGRRPSPAYAPMEVVAGHNRRLSDLGEPDLSREFDFTTLSDLRAVVAVQAERAGLPADRVADLTVAVNELTTNTVTYNGGGVLRVWRTADGVACEVHDGGELTDPLTGRLPPRPDSPRGRGLMVVNHLCDLVRVHTGAQGTRIRVYVSGGL